MSAKEIVADLLERLPDDVSMEEFLRQAEFMAGVREGLAELDRGEYISIEEVEAELPTWVIK